MLRRGTAACFLVLGLRVCIAQDVHARQFEGSRIVSVRFEPEVQPIPAERLIALLPLKTGTEFQTANLRAAIQRLYATGEYSDITVEGRRALNGLEVIFKTTGQWFVGGVGVTGNLKRPPTRGQLHAAANLELGRPVVPEEIDNAAKQVAALMRRNGFCAVDVKPGVTYDAAHQQQQIHFYVRPGERAKLRPPVVSGNTVLPPEEVAKATGWRGLFGWRNATQANLNRGVVRVRGLYQKQGRLLARVSLADTYCDPKTREVTPTLSVSGGPKVRVQAAGARISQRKLKKYVPIYGVGAVDRDLLAEGATNLRDYFQNQGYFDAEVDYQFKQVDPDREDIIYVINPGRRHRLVRVIVEGNRFFGVDTIRERMYIQPAGRLQYRHGRYSQGFARRDRQAIEALYHSNGFRDVIVDIQTIDDYQGRQNDMAVVVRIAEGAQYLVGGVSITGVQELNKDRITSALASIPGQPFSETNVTIDRDYIIGLYNAAGFPDAAFDWKMQPGPGPHCVSVEYIVAEGPRFYVRDVLLIGRQRTRDSLLEPGLEVHKGQPLSLSSMTRTQQNFHNLGVFERVGMAVQNPDGEIERKYVLYDIEEARRYRVSLGFGAEIARLGSGPTTDFQNPGGTTGFSPRVSFDITRLNLWGLAHRAVLAARASTLEQFGSLNYLWPRFRGAIGRDVTFSVLADKSVNVNTFTSERLEGAAQISQTLSRASTVLGSFSYRRVAVSNLQIDPLLVPLLAQPVREGILSGTYLFDRRDNPVDAASGIFSTFQAGVSARIFGSQRSYTRLFVTNSTYHRVSRNLVFAQRIQFGWLAPFAVPSGVPDSQAIPLPERFYAGGATSHRGFPENQSGPRDPVTGFPLGGNALLIHNTELRFPLLGENIRGVLFHDMGNTYSTIQQISFRVTQKNIEDFNYMVHAVGLGLRYSTPVGPVRVDLAYSINPPSFFGLKGTTQQLLSGTAQHVQQQISHFQFFISIGQAF